MTQKLYSMTLYSLLRKYRKVDRKLKDNVGVHKIQVLVERPTKLCFYH